MAREIFNAYHSYLQAMEPLSDAERGRLFTACLLYSMTGKAEKLRGNERFVFPGIQAQIDRDKENYESVCNKNAEIAKEREKTKKQQRERTRACTNVHDAERTYTNEKDKEKEKENKKEKDVIHPLTPLRGQMDIKHTQSKIDELSEPLRAAMLSFAEMRLKMKAPLTDTAVALTVSELERLAPRETDKQALIVMQSVQRGWRGVFPLPEDGADDACGKQPSSMDYAQRKYTEEDLLHLYVDLD